MRIRYTHRVQKSRYCFKKGTLFGSKIEIVDEKKNLTKHVAGHRDN